MNEKAAKVINRLTRGLAPVARRALKREWELTPHNRRGAFVVRVKAATVAAEQATPTVQDYLDAGRRNGRR